jgi:glycosyltransferase involved in cell wall biosynthesis
MNASSSAPAVDFSVVIPTFRRPDALREAIGSASSQTGVTLEIIIVDDSPEGSAQEIAERCGDSRIRYVRNSEPSGGVPSRVRNLGWPLAKGAFVHFLDDDDIVADGHYAAVKAAFEEHPGIGLVFGRIDPFGLGPASQLEHETRYFARAARKARSSGRFGPRWAFAGRMLFDMAMLVCSASVVRRTCLAPLGGFDPRITLMEDADFHLRVMREFGAHFLDRSAIRYRIGSPSLMHSPNPSAAQRQAELDGRRRMQAKYREVRGSLEFFALAAFTRTILRVL